MVALKDKFRAVNSESGIVITFTKRGNTYEGVWIDSGVTKIKREYDAWRLEEWLKDGYLFLLKDSQ